MFSKADSVRGSLAKFFKKYDYVFFATIYWFLDVTVLGLAQFGFGESSNATISSSTLTYNLYFPFLVTFFLLFPVIRILSQDALLAWDLSHKLTLPVTFLSLLFFFFIITSLLSHLLK